MVQTSNHGGPRTNPWAMTRNVMAKIEIDIYTTTQASGDPGKYIDDPGTATEPNYRNVNYYQHLQAYLG